MLVDKDGGVRTGIEGSSCPVRWLVEEGKKACVMCAVLRSGSFRFVSVNGGPYS